MKYEKKNISASFNRIAKRYDLINRLMSFGFDVYWRKRFMNMIDTEGCHNMLDLACGTGDISIQMARRHPHLQITGVDLSDGMLEIAERRIDKQKLNGRIELIKADILKLPFDDSSFDIATIVFGLRNLPDIDRGLSEISRVIKPGGSLYIMEFSIPKNQIIHTPYMFYLRNIIPAIGTTFSGDRDMYRYFVRSIETFPASDVVYTIMREHFCQIEPPLSIFGGSVSMYQASV